MNTDHITPQGPGYGLPGGKRSLLALVCVLAVLTLSACSRGEKSRFTDDSLAALVPAEAKLVFEVDVPTLLRTFETVTGEKVPATPGDQLLGVGKLFGERSPPPPQLLTLVEEIDPLKNIRRVLFAGTPPEFIPRGQGNYRDRQDHLMFLFEGNFGERSKIVEALAKVKILSSSDPDVVDGLEVYTCVRNFQPFNYLTFLSESRALLTSARYLQKVVAIRKGAGESILSSEALKSLTDGFSTREPLWGAIFLSEEVKKAMGPPPRRGPEAGMKLAEVILAPDAALLALSPAGKDFSLRLVGVMPTPEKAAATSKTLDDLLGEVPPELTEAFGPLAVELLSSLTPKAAGNKVSISFKSSEAMIAKVQKKVRELVVPSLLTGRDQARKVQCFNNLKRIYLPAVAYAQKKYEFPRDKSAEKPRAHDSLNILLRSEQAKSLSPELFKCPASGSQHVHKAGADGKFHLDGHALDYAWANVRRRPTGKAAPLAACSHHEGILIVLFTDSAVIEWNLNDPVVKARLDPETGLPKGLGR